LCLIELILVEYIASSADVDELMLKVIMVVVFGWIMVCMLWSIVV